MLPARACTFSFITTWFSSPEFLETRSQFTLINPLIGLPRDGFKSSSFSLEFHSVSFWQTRNMNFNHLDWMREDQWLALNVGESLKTEPILPLPWNWIYSRGMSDAVVESPQANLQKENNAQLVKWSHIKPAQEKTQHQSSHIFVLGLFRCVEP